MGDPELRSDEKVLVRTPGVYVKSIPFEGILTNKRIILIDRAKNLLPPKEIPLVTIKEVEPGENAIRDQIITVSVMAKTGEIRQMILTFSRQAGGNRIKERDTWIRIIRENASTAFDQVIRKVIPGTEPAPRRTEPVAGPRYEIVSTPIPQQPAQPAADRLAGSGIDDATPVRRVVTASPPVPPAPAAQRPEPPVPALFCPKCGNRVPGESVFCNRCGTPIRQAAPVPAPVQTPAAQVPPPVVPAPAARPIDQEIRSIEPLIERSTERVPADALRITPVEPRMKHPLSWEEDEESSSPFEETAGRERPVPGANAPESFAGKSYEPAPPPLVPSYSDSADTPPPPRPPSRSIMPGKQTLIKAAGAVFVILLVAAAAVFILPMLGSGGLPVSGGPGDVTPTPGSSSSTILKPGTIVVRETVTASIPPKGVYVHINYLGGFKGSYGVPEFITAVPGNSGDKVWEVENATNSTVTASFEKQDGSGHPILVEIYRDGVLMTTGSTTVGHGSVSLSVDMVTGKAAEPVTSGIGSSTSTVTATIATPTPEQTLDASLYESGGTAVTTTAPPATTAVP